MENKQLLCCEAHSGLSALLVDKAERFSGIWVSSLTHAAIHGLPDNELVPLKERVELVAEISRISDKPIVVDIDTGGNIEHIPTLVGWFRKAGAYAVIMEDKKYPKQNSLLEDAEQHMEDVDVFCRKIKAAKQTSGEMKVIARLESLIAKKSRYDALLRAEAYIAAGADGIMVHSKQKVSSEEVMDVGLELRKNHPDLILVAVPTTYILLDNNPFDIVIKANHLLRASIHAMQKYLDGYETELTSVEELFNIVGH